MKRDKQQLLLKEKNIYKAFTILMLPVFASNIFKSLNEIVDTYFIGQMANSVDAQAGLALSWPLVNILLAFLIGLAVAGVAVISQLLGAGNTEGARKYAGLITILSVLLGVVVNILLYFIAEPVMSWMGATDGVLQCSAVYLQIRSFEMIPVFLFAAVQAILQAQGDTTRPVIMSVISVIVNTILTGIFVQFLQWGVEGAAWATVIGNASVTPMCIYYLLSKKQTLRLNRSCFKIQWKSMKQLVKIAMPSAGSQAFSSIGFAIMQAFILYYGKEVSAAFSLGNKLSNLLLIPVLALGTVLAAFVGQNVGAGNPERAMKSYKASRNLGLIITAGGALLLFPFREGILALLSNDPTTVQIACEYVVWVLLTQPLMSLFQNYMGVFNGSGNTRYSFIISTARLWVLRLPMLWVSKNYTNLGRSGVWYAMVLSNILILIVAFFLFKRVKFTPKVDS